MRRSITPRLGILTFGHLTIDSYSSFFAPLLPLLVAKLGLSLTMVGTLVALSSISSSFSQPLFGLPSDRMRRPWFVALGPLTAAIFMSALGLAPSYGVLVALLMLAGLGVAAFHPQAAALAAAATGRRSISMAIFVTGGTLGFALGPMFAVGVVTTFGLERTWVAVIPGVAATALLLFWLRRIEARPREHVKPPPLSALRPVLRPLVLLYAATVSRSVVATGYMTFLPLYLHERGYSLAQSGATVSLYLLFGAIGGFFGGWLADRIGGRRVIAASFAGSLPFFIASLFLDDRLGIPCLLSGSFVLQASLPANVVLGQELSPAHSSTISSFLMGAAWGMGALIVGPIGALADARGIHAALLTLACMPAAGLVCAIALLRKPAAKAESSAGA